MNTLNEVQVNYYEDKIEMLQRILAEKDKEINSMQQKQVPTDEEIEKLAEEDFGYAAIDYPKHCWIKGFKSALQYSVGGWIDVKDEPLYTIDEHGNWECTKVGCEPFIAALKYDDKRKPNENLWWVMPCIVEDEVGLCIIGDEENIPAGWELQSVEYYKPLDLTPPINK